MVNQEIINCIESKEYKKAKDLISVFLADNPSDIEIQKYLGLCNINLGCYKEAEENFKNVILNDNKDALSLYYLSFAVVWSLFS